MVRTHRWNPCAMSPPLPLLCKSASLFSLALLGVLPSCAGVRAHTDGTAEIAVPGKWKGSSSAVASLDPAALQKWWRRFRDPVMNEVVSVALRNSPDVRTAFSRIAESRARRGIERAGLFPSLTAGASGQTSRNDLRSRGGVSSSESYSAALDASWEVDLSGRQRLNVRAAQADLAQAEENFYGAQVSLSAEVAETYVNLREAEARLKVTESSLTSRAETVQLTQWRRQAGETDTLESQQAVSTLEQARAAIPSLKQSIAQTRNQLALLSGLAPGALDTLLAKSRPVPAVPAKIATGIPVETLRQRPDVRAAGRAVQAAAARTAAAERARYPSLNLGGSLGIGALKIGNFFSPDSTAASLLGSLAAPIFDGGRIRLNIAVQNELGKQTLIQYESVVLAALSEVENALIAVSRTAERLTILDKATTAANEAATLARQQYQAGSSDILTVLDAERTLLSLKEQQATTLADQARAHVQLYKALGGGWSAQ